MIELIDKMPFIFRGIYLSSFNIKRNLLAVLIFRSFQLISVKFFIFNHHVLNPLIQSFHIIIYWEMGIWIILHDLSLIQCWFNIRFKISHLIEDISIFNFPFTTGELVRRREIFLRKDFHAILKDYRFRKVHKPIGFEMLKLILKGWVSKLATLFLNL